jgi:hypothetical protein
MPKSLLEGVLKAIKRTLAIERRRDERAIDIGERAVIQLLPSLVADLGHAIGNASHGRDRLVPERSLDR